MKPPLHVTPFSIAIEAEVLADLRDRIRRTRWPDPAPGAAWEQGIVPRRYAELIRDPDPRKVKAVMEAMMTMVKLEVAGLERAYNEA